MIPPANPITTMRPPKPRTFVDRSKTSPPIVLITTSTPPPPVAPNFLYKVVLGVVEGGLGAEI
jgi:hypothetical protein